MSNNISHQTLTIQLGYQAGFSPAKAKHSIYGVVGRIWKNLIISTAAESNKGIVLDNRIFTS
jgi:hypothetical protein